MILRPKTLLCRSSLHLPNRVDSSVLGRPNRTGPFRAVRSIDGGETGARGPTSGGSPRLKYPDIRPRRASEGTVRSWGEVRRLSLVKATSKASYSSAKCRRDVGIPTGAFFVKPLFSPCCNLHLRKAGSRNYVESALNYKPTEWDVYESLAYCPSSGLPSGLPGPSTASGGINSLPGGHPILPQLHQPKLQFVHARPNNVD